MNHGVVRACVFVLNRDKVRHLNDILVKNPLHVLRLKTACSNHMTVYEKVKRVCLHYRHI